MTSTFKNNSKIGQIFSENIDDLIFILNDKFQCEYINFQQITSKKKINDYIHPRDFILVSKLLKHIFKTGYGSEEAQIRYDGKPFRWFEIKGKSFIDNEDNCKKAFLICRDITKFKKIEFDLRKSQASFGEITDSLPEIQFWKLLQSRKGLNVVQQTTEMLELVFDNIPQFIYWKDTNLVYMGCNKNFALLNKIKEPTSIIGRKDEDLIWLKDNGQSFKEKELKVIRSNKPEYNAIESLNTIEGMQSWFEINRIPLHDSKNNVVGILVTYEDITEKKITEQKIKESEAKYRHLFESASYSIILIDRNGVIIDCNPVTEKLFNRKINDLINRNFLDVGIKPEKALPLFKDRYQSILKGTVPEPLEIQISRSKDGNLIWISIDDSIVEIGGEYIFQVIIQDITEKKNAEQELKKSQEELTILNRELEKKVLEKTKDFIESEQQYRTTINSLNDPLHVVNRDLTIILANDAFNPWLAELGIDSRIVNRTVFEAFPFLPDEVHEEYEEVFTTGEVLLTEGSLFLNGREIFTETRKIPIFSEGSVSQVITIIRDITESKKMENLLIESEQQYRTTIDSLNDPLHVVDIGLKITLVNKELKNWLSKLGLGENVLGERLSKAFSFLPDKVYEEYGEVFETGKPLITIETTILPSIDVITETRKIPIFSEGRVNQVITIIRDITERKKMENQLKESEENFRNMITNLDEGYYKVEWEGNLIYHNPAFTKIAGYNIYENLIGKPPPFSWESPVDREKYIGNLLNEGFIRNYIVPIKRKDGVKIVVQINAHLIKDDNNNPVAIEGTFSEITEKFRLEQELLESEKILRQQNIELKKMDKIKNDFITMAAHELKTPLISISGYTDYILMKHRSQLNPEVTTDLLTVQRNVNRLEVLMDQLLEVMKIDENELKLQKNEVNISKIISNCLDELSYLINEKNLEIILNIEHEIILDVDPTRIFTVFTNLLSNAIKFTPDYGWVEISAIRKDSYYIFNIKDNGIGLAQDEIGRLFKKFERIKAPILNDHIHIKDSGTGLGLYITKGIINAHGGEIWAKSEGPNKGSIFSFSLPL